MLDSAGCDGDARKSSVPFVGLQRDRPPHPTTDRPLDMQTKAPIHTDSLVPGVFAERLRVHDTVDTHLRTATPEPEPLTEVLAERALRALEKAWAADWGRPWITAILRAAAAEWRAARGQAQRRPTESARLAPLRLEHRRSEKE
jgi:hypothetical protein